MFYLYLCYIIEFLKMQRWYIMLCQYKDLLGKIDEGIHSYRIFNIAIVDVLLTILGAYIINLFIPKTNYYYILTLLFLFGIILHRIFCVRTTIDKLLFKNCCPFNAPLKI